MIATTITLPSLEMPIMPRIKTAQEKVTVAVILYTPTLFAKKPGARRPMKLHASRITS